MKATHLEEGGVRTSWLSEWEGNAGGSLNSSGWEFETKLTLLSNR